MNFRSIFPAILLTLAATGCVYESPLGNVACTSDDECSSGAVCGADGYCVVSDVDPDNIDPGPVLASVTVSPEAAEIALGETTQLTATALDEDGNAMSDVTFTWSSEDETVATVDSAGLVSAVEPGTTKITVAVETFSATAEITVLAPVDSVTIDPADPSLGLGTSTSLTATPLDGNGDPLSNRAVDWSVDDDTILEVLDDGTIIAIGLGEATVTATIEGVEGTATVTVEANPVAEVNFDPMDGELVLGSVTVFTAVLEDGDGNVLDPRGRTYDWGLDNFGNAALSFDPNQPHVHRVVANSLGTNRLLLTVDDDVSVELALTIVPATVEIEALGEIVPVGSERQLTAVVQNASGGDVTGGARSWSSSDEAVATVDSTGLLTAVSPGMTTITFDINGVTATLEVEVQFLLKQVSAGGIHSCGVSPDGVGFCWGDNGVGQLGVGASPADSATPLMVSSSEVWQGIWTGEGFSCGLTDTDAIYCWGASGFTGQSNGAASDVPVEVAGGLTFVALAVGPQHACAIDDADAVHCWGLGGSGRLGLGSSNDADAPTQVTFTPTGAPIAVAAGTEHTCVATDAMETYCWGKGAEGALGNSDTTDSDVPVQATTSEPFVEVTAGDQVTCARTAAGAVWCWGFNSLGQLGVGDFGVDNATTPTELTGVTADQITLGAEHGCLVETGGGAVKCWGAAADFRLGTNDDSTDLAAPTATATNLAASQVSAGLAYTCAVGLDGRASCWGTNAQGQSGTDANASLQQPTFVW